MTKKDCAIVEDLLPLYVEGLVQDETTQWVKDHLNRCSSCSEQCHLATKALPQEMIESPVQHDKMMAKINLKLSIYQMNFIGLSFFLAIRTVIRDENMGFILAYTVLGLLTYLFYRQIKIVAVISFVPVFIWELGSILPNIYENAQMLSQSVFQAFINAILGATYFASIHLLFSAIGMVIGMLIIKFRESGEHV